VSRDPMVAPQGFGADQNPPYGDDSGPDDDDFGQEWDCTHCAGEGTCDDNANPLWDCDDQLHPCHACGGSGKCSDQRIF
jgi:DnaJ-class molecular chaperone